MLSPYVNQTQVDAVTECLVALADSEVGGDFDVEIEDVSSDYLEGGYVRFSFVDEEGLSHRLVLKVYEERR